MTSFSSISQKRHGLSKKREKKRKKRKKRKDGMSKKHDPKKRIYTVI